MQALANDPAFQRTAKGVYTLRALAPEINSPVPQPKTKGQRTPRPPPPRFDPSALTPEPSVAAGLDDAGGDDAVPLDFLDGSSVLAPMPAGTRPEDVHIEAEYIEPVKEEAPENVSSASPDSLFASLAALGDFSALHTRSRKTWSYSYPAQRKNVQGKAGRCKSSWAEALSCCRERLLGLVLPWMQLWRGSTGLRRMWPRSEKQSR